MPTNDAEVGFVSDGDIDLLSNAIRVFDAEVKIARTNDPERPGNLSKQPLTEFYLLKVFPLSRDWTQWVKDNTGFFSRALGDAAYAAFRARYMQLRTEWTINYKQSTTAPPVESKDSDASGPLKEAAGSIGTGVFMLAAGLGLAYILLNRRSGNGGN